MLKTPPLPYAHLNLRFNPFGEAPLEERARLAVTTLEPKVWEEILERLKKTGYAVQFLGDRGRGKTTHLLAIREHFPTAPYIHIAEDGPPPKPRDIPESPLLFLDETQRLPSATRKKLFKRTASWVIGTHCDHVREFKNANLDYTIHEFNGTTTAHLLNMFNNRIRWATRNPNQAAPRLDEKAAGRLIEIFDNDIRAMEGHLYEVFQTMKEVGDVQV